MGSIFKDEEFIKFKSDLESLDSLDKTKSIPIDEQVEIMLRRERELNPWKYNKASLAITPLLELVNKSRNDSPKKGKSNKQKREPREKKEPKQRKDPKITKESNETGEKAKKSKGKKRNKAKSQISTTGTATEAEVGQKSFKILSKNKIN
jgi:hypothetical protein